MIRYTMIYCTRLDYTKIIHQNQCQRHEKEFPSACQVAVSAKRKEGQTAKYGTSVMQKMMFVKVMKEKNQCRGEDAVDLVTKASSSELS